MNFSLFDSRFTKFLYLFLSFLSSSGQKGKKDDAQNVKDKTLFCFVFESVSFHHHISQLDRKFLESYLSSYFISRIHLVSCGERFFKMSLKKKDSKA